MQIHVATKKVVYKGNMLYRKNNERLFQGMIYHLMYKWEKEKIVLVNRWNKINSQKKMSSMF